MLDLNFCTLLFSVAEGNRIIIDPLGDTILTLNSPYTEGRETDFVLDFQVSSEVLRSESFYFNARFGPSWAPAMRSDGKYHLNCDNLDTVGLYVLLLTMHQPFSSRRHDGRLLAQIGLPSTVSLETLAGIVRITDYFQMRPASCLLGDSSNRWFDQFRGRDRAWVLPNSYGEEIMMWWCLARDFEMRSLKVAVEQVIFRHTGKIENFGWPICRDELDGIEQGRGWSQFG